MLRSFVTVGAAALALAAAGCGGGGSSSSTSTGAAASPVARTTSAGSLSKALRDRGAAMQACTRQSGGDPHKLASCLGSKGLISSGLASCLQGASSSADVDACVQKAGGK